MMFALASLVAVSLPLLWQLPMGVNMIFGAFMLLRIALLYKGVRSLKTWQNGVLLLGVFLLVMQQLGTILETVRTGAAGIGRGERILRI